VSTATAIEVEGLRRDYGERTALREVGFSLGTGETMVVLGPNGAGKTTLLRVLGTLLRPHSGDVRVLGCALPEDSWKLRGRVGFVGHDALLYRELSGRENLRFHARLHGLDRAEAEGRIEELLAKVGMARRADDRVDSLTAGMRQRLSICRGVLHDPGLLLLDEPTAHLDPEARDLVEPVLRGESRTRVVVSHEPRAALAAADRVLALDHRGSVAYEGPAAGAGEAIRGVYGGDAW
jgi:heme exporter protein A